MQGDSHAREPPELIKEVRRDFGPKRIWLTEYGYQTNLAKRYGVSEAAQARYLSDAAWRVRQAPYVDMLIQFLVKDEAAYGWQSGLITSVGQKKPSYYSYQLPLAQVWRRGLTTKVWDKCVPVAGCASTDSSATPTAAGSPIGPWSVTAPGGSFTRLVRALARHPPACRFARGPRDQLRPQGSLTGPAARARPTPGRREASELRLTAGR